MYQNQYKQQHTQHSPAQRMQYQPLVSWVDKHLTCHGFPLSMHGLDPDYFFAVPLPLFDNTSY